MAARDIIDTSFFALEYDEEKACFWRRLPPGAEDLGGGDFRLDGKILTLPPGKNAETKILAQKYVRGKDILTIARRGYNPLIKSGPVMAGREERLMELGIPEGPVSRRKKRKSAAPSGRAGGEIPELEIILRAGVVPKNLWRPLDGLPYYRFYENKIYEIIHDEDAALFSSGQGGGENAEKKLLLRGEEIPAFADDHARLIYVFADRRLYGLLSQDAVFARTEDAALVLHGVPLTEGDEAGGGKKIAGKAAAIPALKYQNKLYSAPALSRYFRRKYLPLGERWIRRETLEQTGIGPLGRFINGESLLPFRLKARDLLSGGGDCLKLLSAAKSPGGLELDRDRWTRYGSEEEIFSGHFDFLRAWGISGGTIINDKEKAASFLAAYLRALADELEKERHRNTITEIEEGPPLFDDGASGKSNGRVLVLMPKIFWERRLSRELPQSGEGPPRVPAGNYTGAASIWDPVFSGIGLGTYADPALFTDGEETELMPRNKRRGKPWDILVAVGLDEITNVPDLLRSLETIPARLRLGVFFSSPGVFGNSRTENLKAFFGIGSGLKDYEKYLIRETGDLLSLPAPLPPPPGSFSRPPKPWEKTEETGKETPGLFDRAPWTVLGGGRFLVETKFKNMPLAGYRAEQEDFFSLPDLEDEVIFTYPGGEQNYNRLGKKEKNYFLFWRAEFRRGTILKTAPAYILLYARELILRMDAAKKTAPSLPPPEETQRELRRLWTAYGDLYPAELKAFPRWLLDFAVIYNTPDAFVPGGPVRRTAGTPRARARDHLPRDLYLHKKYVEENHALQFADFIPLLEGKYKRRKETEILDLIGAAAEEALNTADMILRKNYGKKLLEFFYPLPPAKEQFSAFEGLSDLGSSAYTAEWISFSRHKPFIRFISSLAAFVEFRIAGGNGSGKKGRAPFFDETWKYLSGFREDLPPHLAEADIEEKNRGENAASPEQGKGLEEEKINRLRKDSDAVKEMLKVENSSIFFEGKIAVDLTPPFVSKLPAPQKEAVEEQGGTGQGMRDFVAGLDKKSLGFLELISRGGGKELDTFARENGAMADFIIDEINEKFLAENGDLLIEYRVDEGAVIQEEYRDEVLWALTFRNA